MNGRKLGRLGVLALLPMVCGTAVIAQTLDKRDATPQTTTYTNPDKPAKLVFEETRFDFGRISDDGKQEHVFKFKNEGAGTLIISNVKGSCSCTVPALEKKEFAPGETGEIRVIFNPKSKAGPQHQAVTINSNSADLPLMQLNIAAYVRPEVVVEPRVGHFGEVPKDQEATVTLTVIGRSPDFEVQSIELSDPDNFTAEMGKTVDAEIPLIADDQEAALLKQPGSAENEKADAKPEMEKVRECKITVTMKPGQPVGLIRGKTLTINTNDPKRPPLQVELMAQHKGDLDIMPRRLTLGSLAPGQAFHQEVTVKSTSGTPFKVLGIEHVAVAADALDYSFYPVDPANPTEYKIIVDGAMPEDARVLRGRLLIRTDMDREEEIYLYYYAQARPTAAPQTNTQPGTDSKGD